MVPSISRFFSSLLPTVQLLGGSTCTSHCAALPSTRAELSDARVHDTEVVGYARLATKSADRGREEVFSLPLRGEDPWNIRCLECMPQSFERSFHATFDAVHELTHSAPDALASMCASGVAPPLGWSPWTHADFERFNASARRALGEWLESRVGPILAMQTPLGASFAVASEKMLGRLARALTAPLASGAGSCLRIGAQLESRVAAVAHAAHAGLTRLFFIALSLLIPEAGTAVRRMRFHSRFGLSREAVLRQLLRVVARRQPQGTAVLRMAEIGVGLGQTSDLLLGAVPELRLLAVDPWPDEELNKQGIAKGDAKFASVTLRLSRYADRATILRMPSAEASLWVKDASLDLVFIDGDHSYEACLLDLRVWLPKLRPGGIVAGHDYSGHYPQIPLAVNTAFRERPPEDGILNLAPDCVFFWQVP